MVPEFMAKDAPLASMTTFGIGGPADWLARPSTRDELSLAADMAAKQGLPLLVLGGGSNLLIADAGVRAVVAHLDGAGDFARIEQDRDDELLWRVGAAAPLSAFVAAMIEKGVSGLEALSGIPGRVGGAVAMNAGAWNSSVGEYVVEAEAFDPSRGAYRVVAGRDLGFSYRRSSLGGMIAVRFVFRFAEKAGSETVAARARECRDRKKAAQPIGKPSAGCVFKNPPGDSAGSLLERAGCKEMREGAALVSAVHANFIINQGGAGSADVARLAARMRAAVRERHGIDLEPELVLWGDEPEFDALKRGI
jgi:UDP-N-acetylmuramate dehydrogenase